MKTAGDLTRSFPVLLKIDFFMSEGCWVFRVHQ